MRQRIQHAMMRMYRWQAAFVQLILYNLDELLHAGIVAAPVTHNLQAVGQITVCIWEVWLQFQSCAV